MSVGAHINDTIRWRWGDTPLLDGDGKLRLLIPVINGKREKRDEVLGYLAHDGGRRVQALKIYLQNVVKDIMLEPR